MICPECNREYDEGVTLCGDCKVELIRSIDDMVFLKMYRDPGYASMAREYLEEGEMEAVSIDYPYDDVSRLYAHEDDEDKARDLLSLFDNTGIEERRKEKRVEPVGSGEGMGKRLTIVGLFFILVSLWGLIKGIYWISLSWDMVMDKRFFHGPAIFALGVFSVIFIITKWYSLKKGNLQHIPGGKK